VSILLGEGAGVVDTQDLLQVPEWKNDQFSWDDLIILVELEDPIKIRS
jgi:hypothetical protein